MNGGTAEIEQNPPLSNGDGRDRDAASTMPHAGQPVQAQSALHNWLTGRTERTIIQLFRYFWVGGVAAAADFGTFACLTKWIGVYYLLANVGGFCVGLTTNYLLSIKWVFSSRTFNNRTAEFALFAAIGVIGLGFNELVLYTLHGLMRLDVLISKIGAIAAVFAWNFAARKVALFKSTKS